MERQKIITIVAILVISGLVGFPYSVIKQYSSLEF